MSDISKNLSNTHLDQYYGQYQLQKKDNIIHVFGLYYEYGVGTGAIFRVVWGRQNAKQLQNRPVSFIEAWKLLQKQLHAGYKISDKSITYWADYQKVKLLNTLETSSNQTDPTKNEKDLVKKRRVM